jgi:dTDP-4-dehydrorhamnose 3,5-epimerase
MKELDIPMEVPEIISGGSHTDTRGTITFFNDFDMSQVKRFYVIENASTNVKRGWRGHKIEQRWFSVSEGAFNVRLVQIDNWEAPDKNLPVTEYLLSAENTEVLHIPVGYASCVQAAQSHSKLIVFADYGVDHASNDNYLFPEDYFSCE